MKWSSGPKRPMPSRQLPAKWVRPAIREEYGLLGPDHEARGCEAILSTFFYMYSIRPERKIMSQIFSRFAPKLGIIRPDLIEW